MRNSHQAYYQVRPPYQEKIDAFFEIINEGWSVCKAKSIAKFTQGEWDWLMQHREDVESIGRKSAAKRQRGVLSFHTRGTGPVDEEFILANMPKRRKKV